MVIERITHGGAISRDSQSRFVEQRIRVQICHSWDQHAVLPPLELPWACSPQFVVYTNGQWYLVLPSYVQAGSNRK